MKQTEIEKIASENFTIRQAKVADIPRIVEIWKQGLAFALGDATIGDKANSNDQYSFFKKNILAQNDTFKFWLYINPENQIISWCSIMPFHPNPLLQDAWGIMSMYIDEAYQNKMHGYYFSKFVLDNTSNTSIRYILSIVSAQNERVIRLSIKMGFVTLGTLPHTKEDNQLVNTEMMIYEA